MLARKEFLDHQELMDLQVLLEKEERLEFQDLEDSREYLVELVKMV